VTQTESVISAAPFVVRRRVKWSECDPAGVVDTVVFSEYVLSAAELFYERLFGIPPQRAKEEQGFGTPSRALSLDSRRPLRRDEEFDMTIEVGAMATCAYRLDVTARIADGSIAFTAQLTSECIARDECRAIPVPAALRRAIEGYREPRTARSSTQR